MQTFVDRIYDATRVEMVEKTADSSLIKVRNFEGREAVLGIKNNQAVINGQPIHADRFVFLNGSGLEMTGEKSVAITLIIEDKDQRAKCKAGKFSFISESKRRGLKGMKNERGSTLVLVLIVLLVFSVLGLSVVGNAMSEQQECIQRSLTAKRAFLPNPV